MACVVAAIRLNGSESSMNNKEPKILYFDIETAQNLVAVFSLLHNDFIDPSNIIRERYIISVSWLWAGEKIVHAVSVLDDPKRYARDPYDDKYVIESFYKILLEADVVVGHNSDNFDLRWIKTRALVHGLPTLPPITSIDTYKIAKSKLYLNSNKLDYVGRLLKVGQKKSTTSGLWLRVLQGDKKAIKEMVGYNQEDVRLLEKVYLKLRPLMDTHVNRQLYGGVGCPRCGSKKIQSRGTYYALTRSYSRYCCNACHGWFRDLKAEGKSTTSRVI